ncbi:MULTISPECIES: hypothetical protein [unclassified Streptomyces]|uniref:hypothetical protein n=1 Tax=unclassified Streptomyces TaxID=2593676 RepID=UPI0034141FDA
MLRELLERLPQLFENIPWGSPAEVHAVVKFSDTRSRQTGLRSVQWSGDTYLFDGIRKIEDNPEIQLLAIDVAPDVDALVFVSEAVSTEETPDGSVQNFEIRYFQGVTRQGETDTLITYRSPGIAAEFDNVTGPVTVCLEHLLGAPPRRSLLVGNWLAAVAASRVSDYLSNWNEGAPPGQAPLWISARFEDQQEFFSGQLGKLTGRAIASVCWEASNGGMALPPRIRHPMAGMIAQAASEFDLSLALDAARELVRLTWRELATHAQSADLLPVRKDIANKVTDAMLGRFAGTVLEPAEVILNQWAPYAGQTGADEALDILRSTGWLSE